MQREWEVDMVRKLLLVWLSVLMIASSAGAGELNLAPNPAGMTSLERFSTGVRNFSPVVKQAGYYCRRDCDWCRNDCYNAYRINCYWSGCRRSFVLCMRGCWYNICRNC